MKWLNSLDELLFEVMSWLVFFPLTLWRTLVRPLRVMAYADEQLALPDDEQYAAAVSPPLFLALALLIAHGAGTALGQSDAIIASNHGLGALVDSETNALLLRMVIFAAFPLVMSVRLLRRRGVRIMRGTLRQPFYSQCYPAAAFALTLNLGIALGTLPNRATHTIGVVMTSIAFVYFVTVETRWFMAQLAVGPVRAFGAALLGVIEGFTLLVLVGYLFTQ